MYRYTIHRVVITSLPCFALGLLLSLAHAPDAHAQASPGCGPESRWTGAVCIGPRGKAYCPEGMTMQGQACAVGPAAMPMQAVREGDSDHARIIAMLTNLTNQVSQQQAVITDLQQKLIAITIIDNLTLKNSLAAAAAAKTAQANVDSLTATANSLSSSVNGLNTNIATVNAGIASANSGIATLKTYSLGEDEYIRDMGRRLYMTCYMVASVSDFTNRLPTGAPNGYDKSSCTAQGWTGTWNFNILFGDYGQVAPAIPGQAEQPGH